MEIYVTKEYDYDARLAIKDFPKANHNRTMETWVDGKFIIEEDLD